MSAFENPALWFLGALLIASSLGVLLFSKPVHASLSFLLTLICLAGIYLQLSAQFIAVMQVLVYAGAILVIFMFVIILFQDAHQQIDKFKPNSVKVLLVCAGCTFLVILVLLGQQLLGLTSVASSLPKGYGTVESLGHILYFDYFFPFEAVILLFLVAVIGAFYIGKKEQA